MKIGGRDWGSSKQEMRQWEWSWGLEMGAAGECKTDQEIHRQAHGMHISNEMVTVMLVANFNSMFTILQEMK